MSRDVAIVVGTVVGGIYGEPGLGYAIGSLVGNAYDPLQIGKQGPRLNDLKVQVSDYGKMVPKLYGASRFAGNVIWSTDIIETQHNETSGGKGGGPEVTTTTYTYAQSFAVGLCEGEVAGIGKIWANGKLIYNKNLDADAATITASRALDSGIRFYTGSETQVADSLIEAHVGVGNTPAYRGTAYVVFENLQLASFGNRTPNLEFELIESGTVAHPAGERTDYTSATSPTGVAFDPVTVSMWVANFSSHTISKFNLATGARTDYAVGNNPVGVTFDSTTNSIWCSNQGSGTVSKIEITTGVRIDYAVGSGPRGITFDSITRSIWVANINSNTVSKVDVKDIRPTEEFTVGSNPQGVAFDENGYIWVTNQSSNTVSRISVAIGSRTDYATGSGPYGIAFDPYTQSVWVTNSAADTVSKINSATGTKVDYAVGGTPYGVAVDSRTQSIWIANSTSNYISKMDAVTGSRIDYTVAGITTGIAFDPMNYYIWATCTGVNKVSKVNVEDFGLTTTAKSLSEIVSNICTQAGLTAAQIDVTQLTDTVVGYVTQRSTARAQIEQLMQTFFFDAVESDGKVKFVKRGGATALTIAEDDLAAHLYGGQVPENLAIERKQDMELPVEVNIQYMDIDAAYQVNSQRSQRLTTDSSNKLALNFAISMGATKAKQVSDVLMYDAWTSRTVFSFANGWKYSYLEPTDVINVVKGARTHNVRIVDEDAGSGVYARGAVLDDAAVYTQTAVAAPPTSPSTTVAGIPLINLMLLDIPLLRDQDDAVGFYAAACKYSGTWPGAQTYKSNDGGASWATFGRAILNEATIGSTSTALGNFLGGNIFDELNSVTVVMINGTLSSATELAVLNGANVMLIGSEIIQFKTATLASAGTYVLTGLLRGRQGTEWAISTHVIGDRAVLLSTTTTYLFDSGSAEYNLAREYKAAGFGSFLDDALTVSFTNTGIAQECYAPVHVKGGRTAANDVVLYWTRRTRVGGAWNNYADVPLGEATEAYVVEIYSSATYVTLLRTISGITSPTTTYTAAQQTTDGLTPGNPVYFIVYQVSATVGNGYGTRGVAP